MEKFEFTNIKFKSLIDLLNTFNTEEKCIDHLEYLRWKEKTVSPYDKDSTIVYLPDNMYYCCATKKLFNVRTNTCFEGNIPLQIWFVCVYLCHTRKVLKTDEIMRITGLTEINAKLVLKRFSKAGIKYTPKITTQHRQKLKEGDK